MSLTDTEEYAEELETVFARHKLGHGVQRLWDERMIAIHWESIPSARSEDYESTRGANEISKLNEITREGAIVGGSYRKVHKNQMLVGVVEPNSDIQLLVLDNVDGSFLETATIEPGTSTNLPYDREDVVIYKCVQMTDVEVVTRQEQPLLFDDGVRPPFWSVCGWDGAESELRAIASGELQPYEVKSLTTDQLEVVCEEYLRIVDDEYARTHEIGGVMSDVDIMGFSGKELVWAQVTQGDESQVRAKIDKLGDYTGKESRVIIFAPESSRPSELDDEITFVPIEGVFATVDLNKNGTRLLSQLLNRQE